MNLKIERYYPLIGGILLSLICLFAYNLISLNDTSNTFLSTVVTISAIAIGFIATSKAILISIQDRPLIKQLKKIEHSQPGIGDVGHNR